MGPALGALLAVIFYKLVKALEYETANAAEAADKQDYVNNTHHDSSARGLASVV